MVELGVGHALLFRLPGVRTDRPFQPTADSDRELHQTARALVERIRAGGAGIGGFLTRTVWC